MKLLSLLLAMLLLLSVTVLAANDPGHDSLYILRTGDNVSATLNFSAAIYVKAPTTEWEPATKGYVDARMGSVSTAGGWSNTSLQTYTQLIANVSNASGLPVLLVNPTKGYVGIGTPNPLGRLHIMGNVTDEYLQYINQSSMGGGQGLRISNLDGNAGYYTLAVESGPTLPRLMVENTGRIGVGKSLPGSLLDVAGNASFTENVATGGQFLGAGTGLTGTAIGLSIGGTAATATAFVVNPPNCAAGSYPLGINETGGVESCTVAPIGGGSSGAGWFNTSAFTETALNVSINSSLLVNTITGRTVFKTDSETGRIGINRRPTTFQLEVNGSIRLTGRFQNISFGDVQYAEPNASIYWDGTKLVIKVS